MSFTSEFKKGGKLKISGVSTMKACQDMNLETLSEKIETMTKYSVEGHFLTLSDDQEIQ
jgi:heat shock protein HslJ